MPHTWLTVHLLPAPNDVFQFCALAPGHEIPTLALRGAVAYHGILSLESPAQTLTLLHKNNAHRLTSTTSNEKSLSSVL